MRCVPVLEWLCRCYIYVHVYYVISINREYMILNFMFGFPLQQIKPWAKFIIQMSGGHSQLNMHIL